MRHCPPRSLCFFSTQHTASDLRLKAPKHQLGRSSHYNEVQENVAHPISSMPRKHHTAKAADILRSKSKAKIIKWEKREYSRGTRYVPVEVRPTASQLEPRKRASKRPRAENNDTLQGGTAPQPMDIDETFWAEEPVVPTSGKRVRQPAYPSVANLTYLPVSACLH